MPVIKSAKKKLRQDKKRTIDRAKMEEQMKEAVKKAIASTTEKTVTAAVSLLDKAAKKHILHQNKAGRIKSRLAHLLNPKAEAHSKTSVQAKATAPKKAAKPAAKKTVKKKASKKSK